MNEENTQDKHEPVPQQEHNDSANSDSLAQRARPRPYHSPSVHRLFVARNTALQASNNADGAGSS
jgi:hypothetical protein